MVTKETRQLVLIDPSTRYPELEVCESIISRAPLDTRLIRPALVSSKQSPLSLHALFNLDIDQIAGVIILGGGASPNDSIEWQTKLKTWLTRSRGVMDRGLPMMGVCYGHQVLAQLCGAKIDFLWQGEISKGLRDINFIEETLGVLARQPYQIVVSHREGVITLPQTWRSLTTSDYIPSPLPSLDDVMAIEAMTHCSLPWWGFQGHIDATPNFLINNSIHQPLPHPYIGTRLINHFLEEISAP